MFVLPSIPDDAPAELKNGLAIRNACTTEGICPDCGAISELEPDAKHELLFHLTFRHEPDCGGLCDPTGAKA